jgi:hypothetical protein
MKLADVKNNPEIPYNTVELWIRKSDSLSAKVKETICAYGFTDYHALWLLKYPHSVQNKSACGCSSYFLVSSFS